MQTTRTPYSVSFMATVLLLLLFACHSTIANAAVALGATRVIYPANQKQVLLPVTNNDPASVYLIQSWIENAGDQKDTQFVITPPLFSMQGKKENTLRIINATNHQLPGDRESLFWVNVKAIPAMEKDQKNEASTLVVGDCAITQRGVITVGVAIHLTAINGSISIRRLNVTLFRYAHG